MLLSWVVKCDSLEMYFPVFLQIWSAHDDYSFLWLRSSNKQTGAGRKPKSRCHSGNEREVILFPFLTAKEIYDIVLCTTVHYHLGSTSKDTDSRGQISQSTDCHSFLDVKLLWWLILDDDLHWVFLNYLSSQT